MFMLMRAIVWFQVQRLIDHEEAERGDVIQTVIIAFAVAAMAIAVMASIRGIVDAKVAGIKL
jgi:hypothetical protein